MDIKSDVVRLVRIMDDFMEQRRRKKRLSDFSSAPGVSAVAAAALPTPQLSEGRVRRRYRVFTAP